MPAQKKSSSTGAGLTLFFAEFEKITLESFAIIAKFVFSKQPQRSRPPGTPPTPQRQKTRHGPLRHTKRKRWQTSARQKGTQYAYGSGPWHVFDNLTTQ